MSRLIIKVCGMRDPDNILEVAALTPDMIGFIFYPKSPRYVKGSKLEKWLASPASISLQGVQRVGVFVNAEIEDVLNRVHDYELDFVQLHGEESPAYCAELMNLWSMTSMRRAELIKAFSVGDGFSFNEVAAYAPFCKWVLFDTKGQEYGGTGQSFDWGLLESYKGPIPFLLSGGIGPDSAGALDQLQHPLFAGIDLNSRFESAPGVKEVQKIQAFLSLINKT
ncbi:MAG: phosphoribosylanthranilate isomerase [Haliscomenobacter sp.]|nr:phosphoribosylanthranilate isomerase [Haliscomenobacter sp.]MBK7476364.1 phosphoribosylanthranilate isomerase [Haliscomenobacter sp.]MBK8879233.1 phosphoribosylanthranilate isomerase [Haliscomenobacter sp.]